MENVGPWIWVWKWVMSAVAVVGSEEPEELDPLVGVGLAVVEWR